LAKRILIYTNHYFPEQFKINEIVDWLSEKEYHIRVITGLPNYPSGKVYKGYYPLNRKASLDNKDTIVNRLFLIPRGSGSSLMLSLNYLSYFVSCLIFTIYILIFKKKYDFIFVHHTSPIFIAVHPMIYSTFRRTRKFLWDLDLWPETLNAMGIIKSKKLLKIIELFVKKIYATYDGVLIGSKGFKEIVENRFNKDVIYFPNWAEKSIQENKTNHILDFKFPDNKFIVMYTGNIGYAQNFKELIKTIKILEDHIHWVFIGGGRYKEQFIELLDKENIISKVSFLDQVSIDQIPSYASKASCLFLSLHDREIFSKTVPAKLQSYMALQKPIIAILKGDGAEIIKDSNCGFVEENYNYNNLAKMIQKMSNMSEEELENLGKNGRSYYDNHFSIEKRKQQLYNLIK
tara:strand:+ start:1936 stop:3144 length:1209 start_codon:yes stop_codon:yes gene_type:complete